jgi:ribose transport system substrate-binding protein
MGRGENKLRGLLRALAVFGAVLLFAVAIAACGGGSSSSSSSSTAEETTSEETNGGETESASNEEEGAESGMAKIDLGTETLEVEKKTPKIGFFAFGLSAYELAYKAQIEKMNEEGSDVTWVEAKYEPALQLKQLQTALTTHEFDAWIIEAVDAEGVCNLVSKQAPEAGIPVGIIVSPTCGKSEEPWGEGIWAPGTLNMVSDTANVTWFTHVFESMKETLGITPETKVGALVGEHISAQTLAVEAGLKAAGIEPVETAETDYTAPVGQAKAQAMLSRNPDIEVIINGYEGITPGVIAALKEAGKKPGEIKIGDIGGSSEITVPNMKAGWLQASAVYDPTVIAQTAIEQMELAFQGEQGPRFLSADPPGASIEKPLVVTEETLSTFEPSY